MHIKGNEKQLRKRANGRNKSTSKKRGAQLFTPEQRAEFGRRGGKAKVAKGLSKLPPEKVSEITSKGGKARQEQRADQIQTEIRGS